MENVDLALTFDDVLLVPAFSSVLPRDVELKTCFSRNIALNIPLVSAAMDTVTEAGTAICLAQAGGIGVIHRNMTPENQAAQVVKVKKFESGVITDPICVKESASIREVVELTRLNNISGVPVLDLEGRLCGIVTSRDLRFESRYDEAITLAMTPRERLVTAPEGAPAAANAVTGLTTLLVEVTHMASLVSQVMSLTEAFGNPGQYRAEFIRCAGGH